MASLDLSSAHIAAWRSRMPADARGAIRDDARPEADAAVSALVEDFVTTQPRRVQEAFDRHDTLLSSPEFGQARRIRLMSYLMNRAWPDTEFARSLHREGLATEEDEAAGGAGDAAGGAAGGAPGASGGGARHRFPVKFLEDYRSLAGVVRPRLANAVQTPETVEVLANALKDFAMGSDAPPAGGM